MRRDVGEGAQGRPERLLAVLPAHLLREPVQAPRHRAEGLQRVGGAGHRRLHVQGRDQRGAGAAPELDQGGGEPPGAGAGAPGPLRGPGQGLALDNEPDADALELAQRLRQELLPGGQVPHAGGDGQDPRRTRVALLAAPGPPGRRLRVPREDGARVAAGLPGDVPSPQAGLPVAASQEEAGEAAAAVRRAVHPAGPHHHREGGLAAGGGGRREPVHEEGRQVAHGGRLRQAQPGARQPGAGPEHPPQGLRHVAPARAAPADEHEARDRQPFPVAVSADAVGFCARDDTAAQQM